MDNRIKFTQDDIGCRALVKDDKYNNYPEYRVDIIDVSNDGLRVTLKYANGKVVEMENKGWYIIHQT